MSPLNLIGCLSMLRHALDQVINKFHINLCPLFLKCLSKFIHISRHHLSLIYLDLEVFPNMFNWVEIWRLCWMGENL